MDGTGYTAEVTQEEFEAAVAKGEALMAGPRATRVWFDAFRYRVVITLTTGMELGFDPRDAQGLEGATTAELSEVQVDALGLAIRFPSLDADFYLPGLLDGRLGNEKWMRALTERKAQPATAASPRNRIRRPKRALADLKRLRTEAVPGSRATIGHR